MGIIGRGLSTFTPLRPARSNVIKEISGNKRQCTEADSVTGTPNYRPLAPPVLDERVPLPERVDRKETVVAPTRRTLELPLIVFVRKNWVRSAKILEKQKKTTINFIYTI